MKYFTLEEAEALIPRLEKIFSLANEIKARAEEKMEKTLAMEKQSRPDPVQKAIERSQLEFLIQSLEETLESIEKAGAVFKGMDPALVDFPFRLNGREVYLCWKLGEKNIRHYHSLEEGFTGRKLLPKKLH